MEKKKNPSYKFFFSFSTILIPVIGDCSRSTFSHLVSRILYIFISTLNLFHVVLEPQHWFRLLNRRYQFSLIFSATTWKSPKNLNIKILNKLKIFLEGHFFIVIFALPCWWQASTSISIPLIIYAKVKDDKLLLGQS